MDEKQFDGMEVTDEKERLESEVVRLTSEVNDLIGQKVRGEISDENVLKEKREELFYARTALELSKMSENKEEVNAKGSR